MAEILMVIDQISDSAGGFALLAIAALMWKMDRRVYRIEIETGIVK